MRRNAVFPSEDFFVCAKQDGAGEVSVSVRSSAGRRGGPTDHEGVVREEGRVAGEELKEEDAERPIVGTFAVPSGADAVIHKKKGISRPHPTSTGRGVRLTSRGLDILEYRKELQGRRVSECLKRDWVRVVPRTVGSVGYIFGETNCKRGKRTAISDGPRGSFPTGNLQSVIFK